MKNMCNDEISAIKGKVIEMCRYDVVEYKKKVSRANIDSISRNDILNFCDHRIEMLDVSAAIVESSDFELED